MIENKIIERYFFFGLLFATFAFTFFIFRPFWVVLVLGASFSIVLYPIYNYFRKYRLPEWFSALLTVLLFFVLFVGPILGIGAIVFNQSQDLYQSVVSNNNTGSFLISVENNINKILPAGMDFDINSKVSYFISFISDNIAQIFSTTFSAVFSFILTLLAIFYFLKDGLKWRKAIIVLSPLADSDDEKIISRLSKAINNVLMGYLLIAVVQGVLMGIGLALFHIPNPALWGVVTAIASLIPSIGTAFVSVPAIIFLFATGQTGNAIGLLIWAIVVVSTIDNFLTPLFIGKKIDIPPLLILFSVLGGISLLGPLGILMGPLAVSLLYTLISIYRNEFKNNLIS